MKLDRVDNFFANQSSKVSITVFVGGSNRSKSLRISFGAAPSAEHLALIKRFEVAGAKTTATSDRCVILGVTGTVWDADDVAEEFRVGYAGMGLDVEVQWANGVPVREVVES